MCEGKENFTAGKHIRFNVEKGEVYSATGKGKIPWISARDIAAVAYHALTDKESFDRDPVILGPEVLSYEDVSASKTSQGKVAETLITDCSDIEPRS